MSSPGLFLGRTQWLMSELPRTTAMCNGKWMWLTHVIYVPSIIMKNLNIQKSLKNCMVNTPMPTSRISITNILLYLLYRTSVDLSIHLSILKFSTDFSISCGQQYNLPLNPCHSLEPSICSCLLFIYFMTWYKFERLWKLPPENSSPRPWPLKTFGGHFFLWPFHRFDNANSFWWRELSSTGGGRRRGHSLWSALGSSPRSITSWLCVFRQKNF